MTVANFLVAKKGTIDYDVLAKKPDIKSRQKKLRRTQTQAQQQRKWRTTGARATVLASSDK